jgi:hypothetical protein
MSKWIDFTQPGGFPLTQDQLGRMQTAFLEQLDAIAKLSGNVDVPVRVTGAAITGTTAISAGWIYYKGRAVRVPGNTVIAPGGGYATYIVISTSATALTFNDGSTPNVVKEETAAVANLVNSTPEDDTHVLVSKLVDFGVTLGKSNRQSGWQNVVVATGGGSGTITGTIYYKKDLMANTLQIRAALTVSTPGDFAASPGFTAQVLGTLAAGYRPATASATFSAMVQHVADRVTDDGGGTWLELPIAINTTGDIVGRFVNSAAAYTMVFNVLLPLD